MKILVLSNCQLVEYQGSGYVIVNTIRCLERLGHDVDALSPDTLTILPKLKRTANLYRMALGMAWWVLKNRDEVKKYNLIFLYGGEGFVALYVLKKILKINIPVILHSNGLEYHVKAKLEEFKEYLTNKKRKWYHFDFESLFKYTYEHVDAILTVSKYDADYAIDIIGIDNTRVFYIEPALPEVYFNNDISVSKKNVITFCGSWTDRKGIDAMIVALPDILRKYPNYKFRIIGAGKAFDPAKIFPMNVLQDIELIPFVEIKEELMYLYKESLIFIHPSVCESFGLTVAEAMFCGCAVITGSTGIAANLVHNKEAIILEQPNADNLFTSLQQLINDRDLIDKLALNGKLRAEELRWVHFQEKLKIFLKAVTSYAPYKDY